MGDSAVIGDGRGFDEVRGLRLTLDNERGCLRDNYITTNSFF